MNDVPGVPADFAAWLEGNGVSLGTPVPDNSGRFRAMVDLDVLKAGIAELIAAGVPAVPES